VCSELSRAWRTPPRVSPHHLQPLSRRSYRQTVVFQTRPGAYVDRRPVSAAFETGEKKKRKRKKKSACTLFLIRVANCCFDPAHVTALAFSLIVPRLHNSYISAVSAVHCPVVQVHVRLAKSQLTAESASDHNGRLVSTSPFYLGESTVMFAILLFLIFNPACPQFVDDATLLKRHSSCSLGSLHSRAARLHRTRTSVVSASTSGLDRTASNARIHRPTGELRFSFTFSKSPFV